MTTNRVASRLACVYVDASQQTLVDQSRAFLLKLVLLSSSKLTKLVLRTDEARGDVLRLGSMAGVVVKGVSCG